MAKTQILVQGIRTSPCDEPMPDIPHTGRNQKPPAARPMREDTTIFRDENRYCEYHEDTKHTKWECLNLDKILMTQKPTTDTLPPPARRTAVIPTRSEACSATTVSAILLSKREGQQRPVFYHSRSLQRVEARYTNIEKLVLAVVSAARRLRSYFRAHAHHNNFDGILVIIAPAKARRNGMPHKVGREIKRVPYRNRSD